MTDNARAAVNYANAQLSTGPRTEPGKARSSRNAVKHGLTSKQLVLAPGEEEEFGELHDSLHQQLAPEGALEMGIFNMLVHAAWNLERFRTLEARLMANGLDSLLDEVGRAGLPVELHVDGEPFRLPQAIDLSAYRIVQEGLTNALKHARAGRADVTVRYAPGEVRIDVHDDGRGPATTDGLGHGLVGIRERVTIFGGEMSAGSANGGGFTLSTRLPVKVAP